MARQRAIAMSRYLEIGRAAGDARDVARRYSVALTTVYRARRVADMMDAAAALRDFKERGGVTLDALRSDTETKH